MRSAFENAKLGKPLPPTDTRRFKLYYSLSTQLVSFELSETEGENWLEEYHYNQFNDVVVGFFSQQEIELLDEAAYAQHIQAHLRAAGASVPNQ
ncbi:hypothetical protein [uncultured Fibrella sp.]|uniref:hypothetical protein n=1 Tax=uncultured Fibrella sp. TaxID=1284596 RepID=UPI0035C985D6